MSTDPKSIAQDIDRFGRELDRTLEENPHVWASGLLRAAEGAASVLNLEAAKLWEERVKAQPDDALALHHLAVIYHGLAVEAERKLDRDLKRTEQLWVRALRTWAKLWRIPSFWEATQQAWERLKAERKDPRADRFDLGEWQAFRQRLPRQLLLPHIETARALVGADPARARMHLAVVRASGFDPEHCTEVRRTLYNAYQPDEAEAKDQGTFEQGLARVREYLELDPDFVLALRDALSCATAWIEYLRGTRGVDRGAAARIEEVLSECRRYATNRSLLDAAKTDTLLAAPIARFYCLEADYFLDEGLAIANRGSLRAALPPLDRGWRAAKEAIPHDRTSNQALEMFLTGIFLAVECRLLMDGGVTSTEFGRAAELIEMGFAEDANDPGMLFQRARVERERGNAAKFRSYLNQAKEQATARGKSAVLGRIQDLESQGITGH